MTETTKQDFETMSEIANRALTMYARAATIAELRQYNPIRDDKLTVMMDLESANDCIPLDLDKFLSFDDGNFGHDMFGIRRHLNRETKQLENSFVPRCAIPEVTIPFFPMTLGSQVAPLTALAKFCRERIEAAEADGLEIGNGDVVDLIADNSDAPLQTIREALVVAGYTQRFPKATSHQ